REGELPVVVPGLAGRGPVDAERRGRGEALEASAPEGLDLGGILLADPADVLGERPRALEARVLTLREGGVEREHLADDDGRRPAVEEEVVAAPEESIRVVRDAEEREAHERRLGELEAARAVLRSVALDQALLLGLGHAAEILLVDRQG